MGSSQLNVCGNCELFVAKNQSEGVYSSDMFGSMPGLARCFWTINWARGPARAVVFSPACGSDEGLGPTIYNAGIGIFELFGASEYGSNGLQYGGATVKGQSAQRRCEKVMLEHT